MAAMAAIRRMMTTRLFTAARICQELTPTVGQARSNGAFAPDAGGDSRDSLARKATSWRLDPGLRYADALPSEQRLGLPRCAWSTTGVESPARKGRRSAAPRRPQGTDGGRSHGKGRPRIGPRHLDYFGRRSLRNRAASGRRAGL